jgi:hypothetical protein
MQRVVSDASDLAAQEELLLVLEKGRMVVLSLVHERHKPWLDE